MQRKSHRPERVGDLIQRELAQIMKQEAEDPRFQQVTITTVKVSRDLSIARVYVVLATLGEEVSNEDKKDIIRALKQAAGFLRSQLAPRLQLRLVPELHFIYDESIAYGRHMTSVLDNLSVSDEDEEQ